MEKINVKDENKTKIGPIKLLLKMIWNSDEDIEAEWEKEPSRKVLEETLEKVDKMQPNVEPIGVGKKGKARKIGELNKSGIVVKKESIKDNKTNYNKDRADEGRERE